MTNSKIQTRYFVDKNSTRPLIITFYSDNSLDTLKEKNIKENVILKFRLFNDEGKEISDNQYIIIGKHSLNSSLCNNSYIDIGEYNEVKNIEITANKYITKNKIIGLLELLLEDPTIYIYIRIPDKLSLDDIQNVSLEISDKNNFEMIKVEDIEELYVGSKIYEPIKYIETYQGIEEDIIEEKEENIAEVNDNYNIDSDEGEVKQGQEKFDFTKTEWITKLLQKVSMVHKGNWYHYLKNGVEHYTFVPYNEIKRYKDKISQNVPEKVKIIDWI